MKFDTGNKLQNQTRLIRKKSGHRKANRVGIINLANLMA